MAARSRRGPSNSENKLLKLDKLQLSDLLCTVCQSILVEPVTLPCYHDFCLTCFNGTIENNALCCPLCRTRIGSWLRTTTKQNKLINDKLWDFIKSKFSEQISLKLNGDDLQLDPVEVPLRLSAPGEIRLEYELEMKRLRQERMLIEQKYSVENELLIRKLDEEERVKHAEYMAKLREDELLAKRLCQEDHPPSAFPDRGDSKKPPKRSDANKSLPTQTKLNTIDPFLVRKRFQEGLLTKHSPAITEDNSSGSSSARSARAPPTPQRRRPHRQQAAPASPELVPSRNFCGRFLKDYLDRKLRHLTGAIDDGGSVNSSPKTWVPPLDAKPCDAQKEFCVSSEHCKPSTSGAERRPGPNAQQSMPVSLPYAAFTAGRKRAQAAAASAVVDTDSEDSMRQELCFFKPIHATATTVKLINNKLVQPLRVPSLRPAALGHHPLSGPLLPAPSPSVVPGSSASGSEVTASAPTVPCDAVASLCHLRRCSPQSVARPSAFVCMLRVPKECQLPTPDPQEIKKTASVKQTVSMDTGDTYRTSFFPGITSRNPPTKAMLKSFKRHHSTGQIPEIHKKQTPKKVPRSVSDRNRNLPGSSPSPLIFNHSRITRTSSRKRKHSSSEPAAHETPRIEPGKGCKRRLVLDSESAESNNNKRLKLDQNSIPAVDIVKSADPYPKKVNGNLKEPVISPRQRSTGKNSSSRLNGAICMKNSPGKIGLEICNGDVAKFSPSKADAALLNEQLRIEKIIAQEKEDLALAKQLQQEWNNSSRSQRYTLRHANKRQLSMNDIVVRAKKMRV